MMFGYHRGDRAVWLRNGRLGRGLRCCSPAQQWHGGCGAPVVHVAFWNETVRFQLAPLFSIDDVLIILNIMLRSIYVTEILWPFYFRETVKVTVRICHKEKPLSRGEAAYRNVRRIPRVGDRGNFHPCWKKQPWQQTLISGLNLWYDASHFSHYTESWMMVWNACWAFQETGDPDSQGNPEHKDRLECFFISSVSVILQSICDINCTQDVGFLPIFFYCRIIHIPHND